MIDTNVYLSRWPCRRLPCDDTASLIQKLKQAGVTQAWVGSFDALLHRDIASVNARLAEDCQQEAELLMPFGAINPLLPDWEEDLRRCADTYKMRGIRLHPNYHGYKLDEPAFTKLAAAADERGLIMQIALRMEDPRTQHQFLTVPDVDPTPLVALLSRQPKLKIQLLNALTTVRPDLLDKLVAAGQVMVEVAMLEGVNGIQKLIAHVPIERVLIGSYFPFFAWESAELKLRESPLAEAQRTAIARQNAESLLKRSD